MELLTPAEIDRLSPPERIALIAQLWDSLDADQLPLTAAQSAELESRLASFDHETLAAAKAQINRFGTPTATELQSSNDLFFPLLALPDAQARRARVRSVGYGLPGDFELNFGRYLPAFGQADVDHTDTQPRSGEER